MPNKVKNKATADLTKFLDVTTYTAEDSVINAKSIITKLVKPIYPQVFFLYHHPAFDFYLILI